MMLRPRTFLLVAALATAFAVSAGAAAANVPGHFEFHRTSNLNSSLVWVYYPSQNPIAYFSPTWRAGSGDSTTCGYINHGWLPLGWYNVWGHWDHYDSTIKGIATYLQNKQCGDGTWRTQLFIHTKETANWGNYCQTYCFDDVYDYYSNGCIHLSHSGYGWPDNIQDAHWWWHNRDGYTFHGSYTAYDALYVYS